MRFHLAQKQKKKKTFGTKTIVLILIDGSSLETQQYLSAAGAAAQLNTFLPALVALLYFIFDLNAEHTLNINA